MTTRERARLEGMGRPDEDLYNASPWYQWGPYLSERQWGTVREDYSDNGDAWRSFPHDHARSRAYRWGEDGLAGLCDLDQRLCFALALWNGRDPILKERLFGLTGPEGNHGEDAKEYWWYLDALPSHAWLRWRYHYPQAAYPYEWLIHESANRGRLDPEPELLDSGVFDEDRYWIVDVDHAKADPTHLVTSIRITNAGPEADTIHVLPTLWFRNTWSWDPDMPVPQLRHHEGRLVAHDAAQGTYVLEAAPAADGSVHEVLVCENLTNEPRLFGQEPLTAFPKDGINDHVVHGAATVNPDGVGTKGSFWFQVRVEPGATVELRLRLRRQSGEDLLGSDWAGAPFDRLMAERKEEADEFHASLVPATTSAEAAAIARQAFAGLIWGKQFYRFDVTRWLDGDHGQVRPPMSRLAIRNQHWRHVDANDVLSMPDPWEYPWFAAWDLAFHAIPLAHLDPAFAKYQLLVLCREWFQHPNGAIPAYEWSFDDVNPPVHAWAALRVFHIDGGRDYQFLERVFQKLLLNFTWWVNRQDLEGDNLFSGGFLGLDNIAPLDRSKLPLHVRLEQSDATGWMAFYCLTMLEIALVLSEHDDAYDDMTTKFIEHFAAITVAINASPMWDDESGFYHDRIVYADGHSETVPVRSFVGLIPLFAAAAMSSGAVASRRNFRKRFARFLDRFDTDVEELRDEMRLRDVNGRASLLLTVPGPTRLRRILADVLDESSFLSPHGVRSLSKVHDAQPVSIDIDGMISSVEYEPAESKTALFGGNSNWRGPVWFPVNYLLCEALEERFEHLGPEWTVECPTGSGVHMNLHEVANEIRRRLVSIYLPGPDGRRDVWGSVERFQSDPRWKDNLLFFEYFHGDDGAGLGASHQTGWTALVADLIARADQPL